MSNKKIVPSRIQPHFKLIFCVVTGFTLLCIIIMVLLSFCNPDAKQMTDIPVLQKNLYELCKSGWQLGFGAIIGLIGGKVT
jgi:hypothetical protein